MDVPLLNGQPYLQVALVNDLDTSPTSELVCADQILGVAVPKMVTCKWEGCGIHVFTNEELIQHVNNSHVTADCEQNYPCFWKGCIREGRPFNARYKMVIHLRTHTGEKPHRCSVKGCEASFGRIENMKIHMRSHTGQFYIISSFVFFYFIYLFIYLFVYLFYFVRSFVRSFVYLFCLFYYCQ